MTTSISIKKVLVGVAATVLLASPLFAMATFEQKAELLQQLRREGNEHAEELGQKGTALAGHIRSAENNLKNAQAAAKKGDLKNAIRLLQLIYRDFLGNWKNDLGAPMEGTIKQLLDVLFANMEELKKQAQQPKSEAPPAVPAGTSKLPQLPIKLEEKIINALKFNVNIVKVNGRDAVRYTASGDPSTVNSKTRIRFSQKGKTLTTVTFAGKNNCKSDKKNNVVRCVATLPMTPVREKTLNAIAEFISSQNNVLATLDVRGGKQFGPGGDGQGVAVTAEIATLLAREKEACDILLQRFAQFNTAVSEGNGALSTSDARAELRKLLDAAVVACGISNLTDEKEALEKVLADLKALMGKRIGSSPTSRGASAISLSDDPKGARGVLNGLLAIFQDKFTIIADLTRLSASTAPATPSAPSTPTSQPQAPPASSPQEACLPPHNVVLLASEVYQRYGKMCWGNLLYVCDTGIYLGQSVTTPPAPDGTRTRLSCSGVPNGSAPVTSQSGAQTPGGQSTQQSGAARGGCNDSLVRSYCDSNNPDLLHYCDGTASERNCRTSPPGNQRCDERFFPEDGRTAVVAACYSNFSPSSSAHSNSFLGSLLKIFRR